MSDSVVFSTLGVNDVKNACSGVTVALTWKTPSESLTTNDSVLLRGHCVERLREKRKDGQCPRMLRRLNGILLEMADDSAKVLLIDGNSRHEYWLPIHPLREVGVTELNQPFEVDEYESKDLEGSYSVGYRYRALALLKDAFIQPLNLDSERRRKLDVLLKRHAQA